LLVLRWLSDRGVVAVVLAVRTCAIVVHGRRLIGSVVALCELIGGVLWNLLGYIYRGRLLMLMIVLCGYIYRRRSIRDGLNCVGLSGSAVALSVVLVRRISHVGESILALSGSDID
jgi:hypothetical protein